MKKYLLVSTLLLTSSLLMACREVDYGYYPRQPVSYSGAYYGAPASNTSYAGRPSDPGNSPYPGPTNSSGAYYGTPADVPAGGSGAYYGPAQTPNSGGSEPSGARYGY